DPRPTTSIQIGINICEDIWVGDGPVAEQAKKGGAKLLINISASPFHSGKVGLREKVLRGHAKKHKVYMAYANLVGGQDELVFDGASMVMGPQGRLLAMAKSCGEELLVVDVPKEKLREVRGQGSGVRKKTKGIHVIADVRFALREKTKEISEKVISRPEKLEEIYQALVLGTRDYVRKNGFEKVVIGLSGGIDSALTAVIAVDALEKENVIGVTMPSLFSSEGTKSDAKLVAENLGIMFFTIPIHSIFQSYLETLKPAFEGMKSDMTEENLQARIRGNILMAMSNKFRWLVLTTGNKSELSTGYCTLYGDMSGGFAVLKDVPKTLVYELSDYRNQKGGVPVIPQSTIDRAPTAELRPNQTDQDTLPPYALLDEIVENYVEKDRSFNEIARKTGEQELIRKVIRMIDTNEYKRRQAAPGIKITPRAFGRDRRFPITNRYRP
ncbi:MAG: NAD+ synthase, partial [Candidatus Omnitrophica bacterium]|nr:NAD+ synthase [Candidatus Omnitrophota bacterium]